MRNIIDKNFHICHNNGNLYDNGGGGSNIDWFGGIIDEVVVYGSAFDNADFANLAQPLSVEPQGKFTTTWANLKTRRI